MTELKVANKYYTTLLERVIDQKQKVDLIETDPAKRLVLHKGVLRQFIEAFLRASENATNSTPVKAKGLAFLRQIFAPEGPYHGVTMGSFTFLQPAECPKFAMLAHLVIREPETFGHLRQDVFSDLVHHQLVYPARFRDIKKSLNELGWFENNLPLDVVMADAVSHLHEHLRDYTTMAAFQDQCGFASLLAHGSDVKATLDRCLEIVEGTPANNKSFSSMFRLTQDCINHIEQEGTDPDLVDASRKHLLRNALEVSGRQKSKDADVWAPMIRELAHALDYTLDTRHVLSYLNYLPAQEQDPAIRQYVDKLDAAEVKKCIKRDYVKDEQYAFICRADLKRFYTENELLILLGHKFSSDLGL
ncbi:hypothetical protein [Pseudomonas serbica]|jgi:hypothetical protein|uniref:hypothetical protein n=1 Tax=Pseudomonas serbica TaxID=2965074 RepID=UPI00237B5F58|nr:hypothetical protein [Pseudomonas serbica]